MAGKTLAGVQVEAISEAQAQALAVARPLVKVNIRRLAERLRRTRQPRCAFGGFAGTRDSRPPLRQLLGKVFAVHSP